MKLASEEYYYWLSSSSRSALHLTREAYDQARHTWLCAGCVLPKPDVMKVDAMIGYMPENIPLNFVSGTGVGVARKDFLFSLGEDKVGRDLCFGRVFGPEGQLLDDWITFIGKHRIIVRGTKHVSARICEECGRQIYFAMGRRYLYPRPPEGISIFDEGSSGLVVREALVGRVKLNQWRGLACLKLPVLSAPRDGLGDLADP
ncbi:MAG: hypothetical protein HY706_07460 [Candidatus Hydrogenedentes bacterium]|nr:hypothetical protein [Candidatus Hydrogenedentota bacterium]